MTHLNLETITAVVIVFFICLILEVKYGKK